MYISRGLRIETGAPGLWVKVGFVVSHPFHDETVEWMGYHRVLSL
jgi:hypothetical protein